jgi:hypothetical protein
LSEKYTRSAGSGKAVFLHRLYVQIFIKEKVVTHHETVVFAAICFILYIKSVNTDASARLSKGLHGNQRLHGLMLKMKASFKYQLISDP